MARNSLISNQIPDEQLRRVFTQGYLSKAPGNTLRENPSFWCGTQEDYDAIETKDPDTIYMILGES
jgi:hypothetical protein